MQKQSSADGALPTFEQMSLKDSAVQEKNQMQLHRGSSDSESTSPAYRQFTPERGAFTEKILKGTNSMLSTLFILTAANNRLLVMPLFVPE